jgi:hypothetical protein
VSLFATGSTRSGGRMIAVRFAFGLPHEIATTGLGLHGFVSGMRRPP